MKKLLIIFCVICAVLPIKGQTKKLMAFPITDYSVKLNDSLLVVQVQLDPSIKIAMSETGLLKSLDTGKDTVTDLGTAKCHLIKSDYYYFSVRMAKGKRQPAAGDLLYTRAMLPSFYEGNLFNVVKHSITINSVEERKLVDFKMAIGLTNAAAEQSVIDSLVHDVRFTGKAMADQQNNQDMTIDNGLFKGKQLFATMQLISAGDVIAFLKYINARPLKYAGHSWKFSEIFATWMTSGTPRVVE